MRLRFGVARALEDEADRLIYDQVRGIKKHSENDILTPWKEKDRRRHEIYVPSGVPEAANRLGIYHRVINTTRPELNSREGVARGLQARGDSTRRPETPSWEFNGNGREHGGGDSLHSFVFGEGGGSGE
jgi:hypothetical protein